MTDTTPGPWHVGDRLCPQCGEHDEAKANLYAALADIVQMIPLLPDYPHPYGDLWLLVEEGRLALAKARGEVPHAS